MRIKYLQLFSRLNIPGISSGSALKLSATGRDEVRVGCVKSIVETPGGYLIDVPNGPHKGHYFVPMHKVEHAGVELVNPMSPTDDEPPPVVGVANTQLIEQSAVSFGPKRPGRPKKQPEPSPHNA